MTNKNPYNDILNLMSRKTDERLPTYFYFGTVTAGDEKEKQIINVGGIEYKSNENELMRANGIRIETGEKVLLISLDNGQSMIILCRVEKM